MIQKTRCRLRRRHFRGGHFDCHSEQAFFAPQGIWAIRAKQPALSLPNGSRSLRRKNRAFGSLPYRSAPLLTLPRG